MTEQALRKMIAAGVQVMRVKCSDHRHWKDLQ